MKHQAETAPATRDDRWLRRESPEVYHMLRAVEGDDPAFDWLRDRSAALYLFTRALAGDRRSTEALGPDHALDLADLFGLIRHDDLLHWLGDRHPELHLLFAAVTGNEDALRKLKKRPILAKLAQSLRGRYQAFLAAPPEELAPDGPSELTPGTAADVGCLIGELHLSRGDYRKAVEAFSRSLETAATADACEGRARAYRALAERDERRAVELRRG